MEAEPQCPEIPPLVIVFYEKEAWRSIGASVREESPHPYSSPSQTPQSQERLRPAQSSLAFLHHLIQVPLKSPPDSSAWSAVRQGGWNHFQALWSFPLCSSTSSLQRCSGLCHGSKVEIRMSHGVQRATVALHGNNLLEQAVSSLLGIYPFLEKKPIPL